MGFEVLTGMLTLAGLKDDYSLFSPLTGLGGRYGGLGLECRWRGLWAIGVKYVSSRSTLLTFRWIWVVSVDRVDWFAYIYAMGGFGGSLVCLYICNGRWRDC